MKMKPSFKKNSQYFTKKFTIIQKKFIETKKIHTFKEKNKKFIKKFIETKKIHKKIIKS
jgi:hypothetical protein